MNSRFLLAFLLLLGGYVQVPLGTAVAQSSVLPDASGRSVTSGTMVLADAPTILEDIASGTSEMTLVNMWATWCAPCIEEFPLFIELSKRYSRSDLRVVFVSVDFIEERVAAEQFLADQDWKERSYFKDQDDDSFVNAFGKQWTGAVPATFLFDRKGNELWFAEGKTSLARLEMAIKRAKKR